MRRNALTPRSALRAITVVAAVVALGACGSDDPVGFDQGIITGQVRLVGTATGVADVTVILGGAGSLQVQTGADGVFRFNSVPLGSYSLTIEVPEGFEHDPSSPPVRAITMVGGTATANFIIRPLTGG